LNHYQIKIKSKASATKAASYFLVESNKRKSPKKLLCFESQARTSDASAVIFHTGHPCPDEKRPASLRAVLWVFDGLRECAAAQSQSRHRSATQPSPVGAA
jgi:hypothetical protein